MNEVEQNDPRVAEDNSVAIPEVVQEPNGDTQIKKDDLANRVDQINSEKMIK